MDRGVVLMHVIYDQRMTLISYQETRAKKNAAGYSDQEAGHLGKSPGSNIEFLPLICPRLNSTCYRIGKEPVPVAMSQLINSDISAFLSTSRYKTQTIAR